MLFRFTPLTLAALVMVAAPASAQTTSAAKQVTIYINGQPIKGRVVTVNGEEFIQLPMSGVRRASALVPGGSPPIKSIQGCLDQPLFNGVIRMTLLEAGIKEGKYAIRFKVANGTDKDINPASDANAWYDNFYAASDDGQVRQFAQPSKSDDASDGKVKLLPGSNLIGRAEIATPPTFKVTRILYRLNKETLLQGRAKGFSFAPISNMEFALNCK